eukprot:jgi/Mesvir1/5370/Mv15451-RA.1
MGRQPCGGSLLIGRPLLRVPKRSLRSLCERHDVAWFEDPTNASLKYARNRVRAVLASGRREATPIPSLGPSGDSATIDRAPEEPGSFPLEKPFISGVGELGHDEASPSAFPLADLRRVVALCQRVRVETTNVVAALVASVASVTPYGTVLVDVVALRVMAEGRGGVGSAAAATAEATAEAEAEGAAAIDDELGALGQMEVEGDTFEGRETCGRARPARVVGEEGGVTRGGERGEPFVSQSAYPPRLRSTRELYARLLRHPARGGQQRVLDNVNPGADGGMPLAVSAPALPFVAGGTRVEWWMGEGQGPALYCDSGSPQGRQGLSPVPVMPPHKA